MRVVGRPHGRRLAPLRSPGAPRCSSTHWAGSCPCGLGSGVCSGRGECWSGCFQMWDPRALQGQCWGLCTAPWGGGRVPHESRDFGQRGPGQHWGGFRENSGAVGCSLELSPAPGRLDSSCFPSRLAGSPPGPSVLTLVHVPKPVHADPALCLQVRDGCWQLPPPPPPALTGHSFAQPSWL